MHKRLAIGLSLAAVCLSLVSFALSRREDDEWNAGRSRRLFPFPWEEAVSVRLDRPLGSEFFDRATNGGWRLRLPDGGGDVLAREAAEALAALAALAWREPLAAAGARPAEGGARELTVTAAAGQSLKLRLGGEADNILAVTADGDGTVAYGVRRELFDFMDWPAERFRELSLLPAESGSRLTEIVVSPAGGDPALRLRLRRGEDGWRLEEPLSWPADEARLDLLIRWVDKLRAAAVETD
ncbi:MAG: DUF4340 domain-containing protein, partial [Planctomycetota bacterium]|nr:DUF4340 domain-containing protein [Planctomycetota bacterium]